MRNRKPACFYFLSLASLAVMIGTSTGARHTSLDGPTVPQGIAVNWLPGTWAHRMQFTVKPDSIQGTGALLDISLLLRLTPAQAPVFASANANGSDLVITKGDGVTVLGHEVVSFDAGSHRAEIWFRVDSLSRTQNTFYLYYSNPSHTTFPSAGAAWNAKYLAVYHFSESPGLGVLKDWGPHGYNANATMANAHWTAGDMTAGQIGQAWNFNGTSHYLQAFSISTPDTSYVISAWVKLPSHTTDFTFQANPGYWHVSAQINEVHRMPHFNAANPWRDLRWKPEPIPVDDQYHWFNWVFDGEADTVLFYFDGIQQLANPWSVLDPSLKHFYTGRPINTLHNEGVGVMGPMYWNDLDLMTGPGDEFRLNERTHSAAWIRTEYRNQAAPDSFYQFGSEETSGAVPVVLLTYSAQREGTNVLLRWQTGGTSGDLAGFLVFREMSGERVRLTPALLPEAAEYTWLDENAPVLDANYWLQAVSRTGESTWLGPIIAASVPDEYGTAMLYARPNPFGREIELAVRLPGRDRVIVRIFNLAGREIRRLHDEDEGPGTFLVRWDGRDRSGKRAAPGAYLVSLQTGATRSSRKILLLP